MGVRGENDALRIDCGNALAHLAEHLAVLRRSRVADGVRHVDGGGSGFNGYANHLYEEVTVGAGGILGRKLDVVAEAARLADRFGGLIESLFAAHLQLVFEM